MPTMDQDHSEVTRLLAEIDAEVEATQRGLLGLSEGSTRHAFINARMEAMGRRYTDTLNALSEQQRALHKEHECKMVPEEGEDKCRNNMSPQTDHQ